MGQQNGVGERHQLFRHMRLAGKDIEAGGQNGAVLQGGDQRRLVHHAAAADIDEDAAGAERLEHGGADDIGRVRAAGQD